MKIQTNNLPHDKKTIDDALLEFFTGLKMNFFNVTIRLKYCDLR